MTACMETLRGRALLAPMAGVTDMVFRMLCKEQGCPFAVSEMLSAKGFLLSPQRSYAAHLLDVAPGEALAVQLFGHEPDVVAEAAVRLQDGPFAAIDLNMGCPAPKITSSGEGSALLRTPELAEAIVRATVRAVRLPVTVKMRIGWDTSSLCHIAFAKRMEDAGAAALTVHGRSRSQMYAGTADRDAIAEVVRAVQIPVIGNGDITDAPSHKHMLAHTGCFATMVGRGAMGNPFLFAVIERDRAGWPPFEVTPALRIRTALRHAAMLCALKSEGRAIPEMRKHAAWYTHGMTGSTALRRRLHAANTLAELKETLLGRY